MAQLKNPKTFFVSGGMSGIGKALALEYARRGADIAIFDLLVDDDVVAELERAKCSQSQTVVAFQASVTDFQQLGEAVTQAVAAVGAPALAINCAGINRALPFGELRREDFERVVQVNVFGTRNFAAAVLPTMERGGRLALVASMAGFTANYCYAAYSTSKFAVVGLGKVLRLEYEPKGIAVSLICPPEVDTPMVLEEMKDMHPVSRALKDLAGSLTVEEAMRGIFAGLDAGKKLIIPGGKAKLTYFCNRYLPEFIMNALVDSIVRSELKKMTA